MGWMVWGSNHDGDISVFLKVQTGCGTHPACSEMGTIVLSLGCDVDRLPASSAKVKNEWGLHVPSRI